MDPQRVADAVDFIEIRRLQDAYADIVTRRAWTELGEVFAADVVVELDLRGSSRRLAGAVAIGEFIAAAVSKFEFFQFGILGTRVHLHLNGDPDSAAARMYMTELRQTPDGHWSQIYGVYHDRVIRAGGGWRFAHRQYHSLARANVPAAVFDFPHHMRLDTVAE